mmetsp:Transcript_8533/g.30426  ORF Transcript_8533/g.30426 Transcript_8533/m.30426 type:complete len:281 (+) Transcript_8533:909-1751(+)
MDCLVHDKLCGNAPDLLGPRCRVKEGLAMWRDLRHNALYLWFESHVQHPICLVKNQVVHLAQIYLARFDEIVQTSRRGNDNVHSIPNVTKLRAAGCSPIDTCVFDARRASETVRFFFDLHGQFSGWCKDKHGGSHPRIVLHLPDVHDTWEQVPASLTTTRLGDGHHVSTLQGTCPGLGLDGGGCGESSSSHIVDDVDRQSSGFEGGVWIWTSLSFDLHFVFLAIRFAFVGATNVGEVQLHSWRRGRCLVARWHVRIVVSSTVSTVSVVFPFFVRRRSWRR